MNNYSGQIKLINRYLITGINTVLVDMTVYFLILRTLNNYSFAKSFGFIAGALFSYIINKNWTFKYTKNNKSIIKFIAVYSSALFINVSLNNTLIEVLETNFEVYIAFFLSTFTSACYNFLGMKFIVFK